MRNEKNLQIPRDLGLSHLERRDHKINVISETLSDLLCFSQLQEEASFNTNNLGFFVTTSPMFH